MDEREAPRRVELTEITPENWRGFARLAVAPAQRKFVAGPVECLARAYVYQHSGGRAVGITAAGEPVGLAMTRVEERDLILVELLIDHAHQGRGLGRAAVRLLVAEARRDGLARTWVPVLAGNEHALRMFSRLGFQRRPEADDDDELALRLEHDGPARLA